MGYMFLAGVFTNNRISTILLVTGGIVIMYALLEFIGIAPRRNFLGRNLDTRVQALVIGILGVVLGILGFVLR